MNREDMLRRGTLTAEQRMNEDLARMRAMESDFALGVKLPYDDLEWYIAHRSSSFMGHWRHRETDTVYKFTKLGLACTGQGTLAVMVHYVPLDRDGPPFERQLAPFLDRFERVQPTTVWERV